MRAYLTALKPKLLVLAETEFWPNMLSACFRHGIPVAVVNGRISDRSWPRYLRIKSLWAPFLRQLDRVLAQSDTDAKRLIAIGCRPERVTVAGNLKFDVRAAVESDATRLLRTLGTDLKFIVAGSTLGGEEAALLAVWPRLLEVDPHLIMVVAPRHPERFGVVADLLSKSGHNWVRRSDWNAQHPNALRPLISGEIVLLDTIGELASVYSLAAVAFVGGSLIPAGGHNPLEPAQFAVPIVMGTHYQNFRAITEDLRAQDAICITEKDDLAEAIASQLCNPVGAEAMGARAKQVFNLQAGATDRCLEALQDLLAERARTP